MSTQPRKPFRIRVRVVDGKPREWNKLKVQLGAHLDVVDVKEHMEFIICAINEKQIEQVRAKLVTVGLEPIDGGNTQIASDAKRVAEAKSPNQRVDQGSSNRPLHSGQHTHSAVNAPALRKKPYGFVGLPRDFKTSVPVWHDEPSSKGGLTGEIRFVMETLTPLLVGWERVQVAETRRNGSLPAILERLGPLADDKPLLCPLRAPWGNRPVIIPGDTLKGLLRHELGALLGAPMERVGERLYSYRPNASFPKDPKPRLIPRLARIPDDGVEMRAIDERHRVRVPKILELLPAGLKYDRNRKMTSNYYRFAETNGYRYLGGQGAGKELNSKHRLHRAIHVSFDSPVELIQVSEPVRAGFLATLRQFLDPESGHFEERHPDHREWGKNARKRILDAAMHEIFMPGDLIWVEWDIDAKDIVSFGWHYYYRWAYTDSVRSKKDAPNSERHGLFPVGLEKSRAEDGAPTELSAVRRLFGYTSEKDPSRDIGDGDHTQLMGRISINAALEDADDGKTESERFLEPTFLKELGRPRPSAVEHYLKQPYHPRSRPWDRATLMTYGDAVGYDESGELAGRKFYRDRGDAYTGEPWKDVSPNKVTNKLSTLVLDATKPAQKFRFTLRFRDLDAAELAATIIALCPHQFRDLLRGTHKDGYCSKLGYARPLGWGSVRIEAKELLVLDLTGENPTLRGVTDLDAWISEHYASTTTQREWLDVHRHKHPDAGDYPTPEDRGGNKEIYKYHSALRAEHSRARRYRRKDPE